jgi:hypothetical protein
VPTKIVVKVGFLERDFKRDHLAEKSNRTKMGQKIHCVDGEVLMHAQLLLSMTSYPKYLSSS